MFRWNSLGLVIVACLAPLQNAAALKTIDYYSPLNRERPSRPRTDYIVLHTTEASTKSSLNEVRKYGEAHYLVDTGGKVYKIIDRRRIATHSGRSMWDGHRTMDNYAIGIEVVGYHNRRISTAQTMALRELIAQLQSSYRITDRNVLCHAMVAYGAPNKWHPKSHRGRKRCGMLFAGTALRARLGLSDKPSYDPDVKAGRLVIGDPELHKILYGSGTAPAVPARPRPVAPRPEVQVKPQPQEPAGEPEMRANSIEGFRVIGRDGGSAMDIARTEYMDKTTIYFLTNGMVRRGDQIPQSEIEKLQPGTKILLGYTYGGYVTAKRSAQEICGARWNYPSTFYRFSDGSIKSGDTLKKEVIPEKTMVFFLQ